MTVASAPPESVDAIRSTDTVFTELIVGMPFSLPLGQRESVRRKHGIEYSPKLGLRLALFWREDLEVRSWRYAELPRAPLQQKMSPLRMFLERHALRVALVALLLVIALPLLFVGIAWQMGLFDAVISSWRTP
jgi:hypothetical protein